MSAASGVAQLEEKLGLARMLFDQFVQLVDNLFVEQAAVQ
jgi:hypothetical protein